MRTNTVIALAPILPAIATFYNGALKLLRAGKAIRIYRPETEVQWTPEVNEAVKTLVSNGYTVKVYEKTDIYTPVLIADTVVWEKRTTHRDRSKPNGRLNRPYSVVEVTL